MNDVKELESAAALEAVRIAEKYPALHQDKQALELAFAAGAAWAINRAVHVIELVSDRSKRMS